MSNNIKKITVVLNKSRDIHGTYTHVVTSDSKEFMDRVAPYMGIKEEPNTRKYSCTDFGMVGNGNYDYEKRLYEFDFDKLTAITMFERASSEESTTIEQWKQIKPIEDTPIIKDVTQEVKVEVNVVPKTRILVKILIWGSSLVKDRENLSRDADYLFSYSYVAGARVLKSEDTHLKEVYNKHGDGMYLWVGTIASGDAICEQFIKVDDKLTSLVEYDASITPTVVTAPVTVKVEVPLPAPVTVKEELLPKVRIIVDLKSSSSSIIIDKENLPGCFNRLFADYYGYNDVHIVNSYGFCIAKSTSPEIVEAYARHGVGRYLWTGTCDISNPNAAYGVCESFIAISKDVATLADYDRLTTDYIEKEKAMKEIPEGATPLTVLLSVGRWSSGRQLDHTRITGIFRLNGDVFTANTPLIHEYNDKKDALSQAKTDNLESLANTIWLWVGYITPKGEHTRTKLVYLGKQEDITAPGVTSLYPTFEDIPFRIIERHSLNAVDIANKIKSQLPASIKALESSTSDLRKQVERAERVLSEKKSNEKNVALVIEADNQLKAKKLEEQKAKEAAAKVAKDAVVLSNIDALLLLATHASCNTGKCIRCKLEKIKTENKVPDDFQLSLS